MSNLHLTIAVGDYDHTRDLMSGRVRAEGIDITPIHVPVEEMFFRYQVSRMGRVRTVICQDHFHLVATRPLVGTDSSVSL